MRKCQSSRLLTVGLPLPSTIELQVHHPLAGSVKRVCRCERNSTRRNFVHVPRLKSAVVPHFELPFLTQSEVLCAINRYLLRVVWWGLLLVCLRDRLARICTYTPGFKVDPAFFSQQPTHLLSARPDSTVSPCHVKFSQILPQRVPPLVSMTASYMFTVDHSRWRR